MGAKSILPHFKGIVESFLRNYGGKGKTLNARLAILRISGGVSLELLFK